MYLTDEWRERMKRLDHDRVQILDFGQIQEVRHEPSNTLPSEMRILTLTAAMYRRSCAYVHDDRTSNPPHSLQFAPHGIPESPYSVDFYLDLVSFPQIDRRRSRKSDACGRAG